MTDPEYLHAGLRYRPHRDVYRYRPYQPFTVDGIHYSRWGTITRAIIELIDIDSGGAARMNHKHPPTDTELDRWTEGHIADDYIRHR